MAKRDLSWLQRWENKRKMKLIRRMMWRKGWQIGGRLYFLDSKNDVSIFVDAYAGRELAHFWMQGRHLKVGNIIEGKFINRKREVIELPEPGFIDKLIAASKNLDNRIKRISLWLKQTTQK